MRVKPVPKRRSARSGTIASETCPMPPRAATACAISAVEMFTPIPPCMIGTRTTPLSSRRKSSSRRSSRLFIYDVLFVLACKGTAPVHRVPEKSARGTLSSPSPHSPCKPLGTTVPIIPSPSKRLQHNHVKTARHEGLSEQPTLEASSVCMPSENDDGPEIAWISGP